MTNYNSPIIQNIGIVGEDIIQKGLNKGKIYTTWVSVISRCYNKRLYDFKYYGKRNISVIKDWFYFDNFREWYLKQEIYEDGELDKDLKFLAQGKESKIYSPETCLIIPARLNQFFISFNNINSNIKKTKNGFQAYVHFNEHIIRSKTDLSFEEATKEKYRIKKNCYLVLKNEIYIPKEIDKYCCLLFDRYS